MLYLNANYSCPFQKSLYIVSESFIPANSYLGIHAIFKHLRWFKAEIVIAQIPGTITMIQSPRSHIRLTLLLLVRLLFESQSHLLIHQPTKLLGSSGGNYLFFLFSFFHPTAQPRCILKDGEKIFCSGVSR